jgi:3-methyladenine DNA glycosylase AlkD
MNTVIDNLRTDLLRHADEKTKKSGERFFREEVKLYGVKTAAASRISKEHFKALQDKSKANVFSICEKLWKNGTLEETFVACNWSYSVHRQFDKDDFAVFERWVNKYVTNWASCDTFCNHTVGTLVEMYPSCLEGLKKWATSENRWVKRASAVSLIVPARKGLFLDDIFEIADILLLDSDDMVQKGYGWMLKVASQSHLDHVFQYILKNKSSMPRTSLRYAIEKMPVALKAEAMKK